MWLILMFLIIKILQSNLLGNVNKFVIFILFILEEDFV